MWLIRLLLVYPPNLESNGNSFSHSENLPPCGRFSNFTLITCYISTLNLSYEVLITEFVIRNKHTILRLFFTYLHFLNEYINGKFSVTNSAAYTTLIKIRMVRVRSCLLCKTDRFYWSTSDTWSSDIDWSKREIIIIIIIIIRVGLRLSAKLQTAAET